MTDRPTPDPAVFERMRAADPALWEPVYGEYDRARQTARLEAVAAALRASDADQAEVEERVEETMRRHAICFDSFEGVSAPDEPASFAFVVPSRLSRFTPDFAAEGDELFPIGALLDPPTRQLLWTGAVPLVVDRYRSANGESGVMLACPLTPDVVVDLGFEGAFEAAQRLVADAVSFATRRFSARVVGLGAILPRLTDYGKTVAGDGVAVTTGHGGTTWLVLETLAQLDVAPTDVGVVGVGAIGVAVATGLLDVDGVETVHLFDTNTERAAQVAESLGPRVRSAPTLEALLTRSAVTVAATTSPVDLSGTDVDLTGRWIIDDSQPSCFDYHQVEALGGRLCWVVASDGSDAGTATKYGYWGEVFGYGGTGPVHPSHIWGCEAEAHAIALAGSEADCIREPVRLDQTRRIGELCRAAGTAVAPLQRAGELLV